MARCLVAGGAGFIGSHLVDRLIKDGHEVVVLDNLSTGDLDNLNDKADFYKGDIRDGYGLQLIGKVDYVFHLAADLLIQETIKNPAKAHDVNINGTFNLLIHAQNVGAKVIFSSTCALYEGLPMHERGRKAPKNPYALHKYMCEQYMALFRDLYGLNYCTLRYFNVYGERQKAVSSYSGVISIFKERASHGKMLTVTGDGMQSRDFIHVSDVVEANIKAMNLNGTFNVGTSNSYKIKDIAKAYSDKILYVEARPGELFETKADNTKLRKTGWRPTIDLMEWIHETKRR